MNGLEEGLIKRALAGDAAAFEEMVLRVNKRVQGFVRRSGAAAADVDDLVQEVFTAAFLAFRSGRYRHENYPSFLAWLHRIAQRTRRSPPHEVYEPESHVPDPRAGPEQQVAGRELAEILSRSLDEVLLKGAKSARERNLAALRRMAFVLCYVDGLSQPEILNVLTSVTSGLQPRVSVSAMMLNNWLSRGDIVRAVVRDLVTSNPLALDKLGQDAALEACVQPDDRPFARLLVRDGLSVSEAARRLGCDPKVSEECAGRIRAALSEYLTGLIKWELHQLRHGQTKETGAAHAS